MLYWPITPDQPTPSAEAYARVNAYLRSGEDDGLRGLELDGKSM